MDWSRKETNPKNDPPLDPDHDTPTRPLPILLRKIADVTSFRNGAPSWRSVSRTTNVVLVYTTLIKGVVQTFLARDQTY